MSDFGKGAVSDQHQTKLVDFATFFHRALFHGCNAYVAARIRFSNKKYCLNPDRGALLPRPPFVVGASPPHPPFSAET